MFAQGESIFKELLAAGTDQGIKIRIAQSLPSSSSPDQDTIDLSKAGILNFNSQLLLGHF